MTPYTWKDWSKFMGQTVRRKEDTEPWTVCGCTERQVNLMSGEYRLAKFYSTMLEDWCFMNGNAFGNEN